MEENENIWHPKQSVAERQPSKSTIHLHIFKEQWLSFSPIIFVAILAEVEKRGEEAATLFSNERGTRAMYDLKLRGGLSVLESEEGD